VSNLRPTPGPWDARTTTFYGTSIVAVTAITGEHIASVGRPDSGDQRANARLLAAAPQLLEACERVLERDTGLSDTSCDELRAAIRIATGKL
jgi:hypothetical protein